MDSTDNTTGQQAAGLGADDRRFLAAHASRTAVRCVDCRFVTLTGRISEYFCDHPETPVSLVDGALICRARDWRLYGQCGPTGRLFVPLDQAVGKL